MGKKKFRKAYNSKGQRPNINEKILNFVADSVSSFDRALQVLAAWRAGKNPWVTIQNPNNLETNRRFIKVRANEYYGDYKRRTDLFKSKNSE